MDSMIAVKSAHKIIPFIFDASWEMPFPKDIFSPFFALF
jgi:alanine-alpha-ketoisovalerate/valine-pyruvate aminotransferase